MPREHTPVPVATRTLALIVVWSISQAFAQEVQTSLVHPRARAFSILGADLPLGTDVQNVQLTVSVDGLNFTYAGVGLDQEWGVLWSTVEKRDRTSVVVPFVADFSSGRFRLPAPGRYKARWLIGTKDAQSSSLSCEQELEIGPSSTSDARFLSRLAEPAITGRLVRRSGDENGQWALNADGADHRALVVVRAFLEATQAKAPEDVFGRGKRTLDDVMASAEALWALAKEIPDSSYAPYAAFLAGLSYWGPAFSDGINAVRAARVPGEPKNHQAEYVKRVAHLARDERVARGADALQFAVDHGDAYLQPRAMYHLGFLRACAGQVEEAGELLNQAVQVAGERGTVGDMVGKFQIELQGMREALAEQRREP